MSDRYEIYTNLADHLDTDRAAAQGFELLDSSTSRSLGATRWYRAQIKYLKAAIAASEDEIQKVFTEEELVQFKLMRNV